VVGQRLAACVNVVRSPVESFYTWKGRLESAREHLLLIKTTAQRLSSLEREVKRLHPYDLPEFIAFPITEGSTEYLAWLGETIRAPRESRAGNRGAQPRIEGSVLNRRLRTD
jgi:periplasmic divalent cation tolerance protein